MFALPSDGRQDEELDGYSNLLGQCSNASFAILGRHKARIAEKTKL